MRPPQASEHPIEAMGVQVWLLLEVQVRLMPGVQDLRIVMSMGPESSDTARLTCTCFQTLKPLYLKDKTWNLSSHKVSNPQLNRIFTRHLSRKWCGSVQALVYEKRYLTRLVNRCSVCKVHLLLFWCHVSQKEHYGYNPIHTYLGVLFLKEDLMGLISVTTCIGLHSMTTCVGLHNMMTAERTKRTKELKNKTKELKNKNIAKFIILDAIRCEYNWLYPKCESQISIWNLYPF